MAVQVAIGKPLMYRMEDRMIYRELPMGAFINCSPDVLEEGSGKFDEGAPISFLADGKISIPSPAKSPAAGS